MANRKAINVKDSDLKALDGTFVGAGKSVAGLDKMQKRLIRRG